MSEFSRSDFALVVNELHQLKAGHGHAVVNICKLVHNSLGYKSCPVRVSSTAGLFLGRITARPHRCYLDAVSLFVRLLVQENFSPLTRVASKYFWRSVLMRPMLQMMVFGWRWYSTAKGLDAGVRWARVI